MAYTNEQLVSRLWATEQIRHTMNRLAYYLSGEERQRILTELWTKEHRESASLGYNNGFYVGMDAIRTHFLESHKPMGQGDAKMSTMSTPLIKLARDGKTAQFLGYMPGFRSYGKEDRTMDSYMTLGLCFADLILEDGLFKIWHLIFIHDHTMEAGKPYRDIPAFGWEDPLAQEFGTPPMPRTLQAQGYGWEHLYEDMPRELDTYTPKYSYGPEGDFGKKYFDRDHR